MRYNSFEGESVKRLGRIIFSGLAVLSLVLCVATVALWARSYRVKDHFVWSSGPGSEDASSVIYRLDRYLISARGGVSFHSQYRQWNTLAGWVGRGTGLQFESFARPSTYPYCEVDPSDERYIRRYRFSGFEIVVPSLAASPYGDDEERNYSITLPHLVLVLAAAILPLVGWRNIRRWKLFAIGHCAKCGYDLRATPERCPECGAIPKKVKA